MPSPQKRAVALLNERFTLDDIDTLLRYCQRHGYRVVAATRRIIGAIQMVQTGQADRIVATSRRDVLDGYLEIISQELPVNPGPLSVQRPRRLRYGRRNEAE